MSASLKPGIRPDRSAAQIERLAALAGKALMGGRATEAIQHFAKVLDLAPGHVEANYQIGRLKLGTAPSPHEAIPFLFAALKADPGQERHWLAAIMALTLAGQIEQARQIMERLATFGVTQAAGRTTRTKFVELLRRRAQQQAQDGFALGAETVSDLALWIEAGETGGQPPACDLHVHLAAISPTFMDVRTNLPLAKLGQSFRVMTSISKEEITFPTAPAATDRILVLQRPWADNLDSWVGAVEQMKALGWIVVVEFDDHPSLIAEVHGFPLQPQHWLPFVAVDAVQTSTPELADAFRQFNPEVACFPNASFDLPAFREPRADGELTVFFGALNRERFSARIGAALAAEPALRGVRYVVVRDGAFRDALGPDAKVEFHPTCPYDRYLELMAGCDICLLPLEGAPGELFKSDLKFIEASSRSLVSLASPAVYANTIRHGETGLIVERVEDWPATLARLVADPQLRSALARNAYDYVRAARQFEQQAKARLDWYRSLCSRRDELAASLRSRIEAFRLKL